MSHFFLLLLATIIISAILYWFFYSDESSEQTEPSPTPSPLKLFELPQSGNQDFPVVGESHYQQDLMQLASTYNHGLQKKVFKAYLIPDNTNKYDKNAVQVVISGLLCGYLSRDDAKLFRTYLKQNNLENHAGSTTAILIGGGKDKHYGVLIDLSL